MKNKTMKVRMRDGEFALLDRIRNSVTGRRNRSEMVRYLIVREARRRSKLRTSVVADWEIATEHRIGRPRKEPATG